MDQDRVVSHVLRDLRIFGIIPEESVMELRPYLMAVWTAGFENGSNDFRSRTDKTHGNAKPIGQFDRQGQLINSFKSRTEAVKITRFSEKGIRNSIYLERPTRQGWQWRYL